MSFEDVIAQATIATERLCLRPLTPADAGLISMYGSDKRVAENTTTIPHPLPPGSTEAFIERSLAPNRAEDVWVIDGKDKQNTLMGLISLERMDRDQSEIAYWVAPPFWNEGVAQTAVRALVEANPMENKTIFASVFQDNPASAKVVTNVGFAYLGDAESFSVSRDTTVPTWTYLKKLG